MFSDVVSQSILLLILAAVLALLLLLYYVFVHGKKVKGSTGGIELGVYSNLLLLSDKGAFARIYRAFNRDSGRVCVLKVLRSTYLGDSDAIRKFNQEAEFLEAVHRASPDAPVTRLYGTGVITASMIDLPFIEMEYIPPSFDLGEYIRTHGRVQPALAEAVIEQVLRALEPAHRAGMVHRDLKPGNILLANKDPLEAVVCDFGVAKQVDSRSMTAGGYGTAAYMSPEQCRVGGRITGKSDIYSLGVVWYEMLAGTKLYDDPNPLLVMRQHEEACFEDKLIRYVPEKYHEILRKMLSVEASARPDIWEIRATLSEETVSIGGFQQASGQGNSAATTRTRRPAPNRRPVFVSLLAILLLTLTVVAVLKPPKRPDDPPDPPPPPIRRDSIPIAEDSTRRFPVPKKASSWPLKIKTSPPGCDVVFYQEEQNEASAVNSGKIIGVTPLDSVFTDSIFALLIKKDGFVSETVTVTNTENSAHEYLFTLERAQATFGIKVPAGDLRVLLDGIEIDRASFAAIKATIGESHRLYVSGRTVIDTTIIFTLSDENDSNSFNLTGIPQKYGWIRVTCSEHPDAQVTIGGRTQLVGAGITQQMIIGQHAVEVSKTGFEKSTTSKVIRYNDTTEVLVSLNPLKATVAVTINMPGKVTISPGDSSFNIEPRIRKIIRLDPGEYKITIKVTDYPAFDTSFNAVFDRRELISHDFPPKGKLIILGDSGDVYIGGTKQLTQAPTEYSLAPGKYLVEVKKGTTILKNSYVEITPGDSKRMILPTPEPLKHRITLHVLPSGSQIYDEHGTPAAQVSENVISGEYNFIISNKDYPITNVSVAVNASDLDTTIDLGKLFDTASRGEIRVSVFTNDGLPLNDTIPIRINDFTTSFISGNKVYWPKVIAGKYKATVDLDKNFRVDSVLVDQRRVDSGAPVYVTPNNTTRVEYYVTALQKQNE